jgi:hypothetical protein
MRNSHAEASWEPNMSEKICKRCHRVCFSEQEYKEHECFDADNRLNAEIAVCNWDGTLYGEPKSETE